MAKVRCLLVTWEADDLGCYQETVRLEELLKDRFGYEVDQFSIPNIQPDIFLRWRLQRFIDASKDTNDRLIIYYGGHGGCSENSELVWAARSEAAAPQLTWNLLQNSMIMDLPNDVLLILDCCYAAQTVRSRRPKGPKEVLAASGWETTTAGILNDTSFTATLIRALSSYDTPFTARHVHNWMSTIRGSSKHLTNTPYYTHYEGNPDHEIYLAPLHMISSPDH